ncbi:lysophospholipid acyltransferase family protein [Psychrobacter sp. I-STPA6b]|uniref:lysophospholipid acyltransferase family protein n=1 Tax=Psychrobacter sp. I-STPA6b TaxID=2585718 RepID=UPI001D0C113A|nr:lysophospholipid acyltransferase family protein [Psychrobacter sp. I-STPA6b]
MTSRNRFSIRKNIARGKQVVGMFGTIAGGMSTARRIGAFKSPPREILPRYIQIFCRKMANTFGVTVVQVEPVPQTHALWASNHVSWMDIPVMGSVTPAFFLSKSEIANWPIFGKLATAAGTLFIQRGSGDSGTISEQMAAFLREGYSILFFPEATTTDGKQIKRIHGKLLQSAIDANKPVQPIVVCYVNKQGELDESIPYYGKMTMAESIKKVMDSRDTTAYVLPLAPLETQGKTKSKLTDELQQHMQSGLEELHRRVLKSNS